MELQLNMKLLAALLSLVSLPAFGQAWMADLQSGQGDAFGIAFFFYLFFCYVNITEGYKESVDKGRKCIFWCTAFGLAAIFIPFVQWLLVVAFAISFLQFAWNSLK